MPVQGRTVTPVVNSQVQEQMQESQPIFEALPVLNPVVTQQAQVTFFDSIFLEPEVEEDDWHGNPSSHDDGHNPGENWFAQDAEMWF